MHSDPSPQSTPAERVAALRESDAAVTDLGIEIVQVAEDRVQLRWQIPARLANGLGLLHGGYTFLLADSALAYLCAAAGRRAVTASAEITYLAGVSAGAVLIAEADIRAHTGRKTICDVRVRDEGGQLYAEFRGHATTVA